MKADGLIPGWKNDYAITAWVHDEIQVATKEGIENDTGNRLKEMAKEAGQQLKVRAKSKQTSPSVQAGQIRTDLLSEKSMN